MHINLNNEKLQLLPERAAYWPAHRMLIIADIHFGKAAAFRAQGIPVPHGTTVQNLNALDALIAQHDVAQILFLGDFLHARTAHAPATLAAIRHWRSQHSLIKLILVRGNHDLHAGDPPADLRMQIVDEPFNIDGFAFCHHPDGHPSNIGYVLAGHVHPVYRLAVCNDSVRLPCFSFSKTTGILPSFGAFTGGYAIKAKTDERIFLTIGKDIVELPSQGSKISTSKQLKC